jgi:hypothetical protein
VIIRIRGAKGGPKRPKEFVTLKNGNFMIQVVLMKINKKISLQSLYLKL